MTGAVWNRIKECPRKAKWTSILGEAWSLAEWSKMEVKSRELCMLVLSRKVDQRIIVGEGENQIVITLVAIRGDKVRVGIDAGQHIKILRDELKRKLAREDNNDNTNG